MVAYPHQIQPPNYKLQLVDMKTGTLTGPGLQFLQQLWAQEVNTNQVTPCTCTNAGNVYTLVPFPVPPTGQVPVYSDYSIFTALASATSTGAVTAKVSGLGTIKVYKSNGATQAGAGDLVNGSLYLFIYNSVLDSSNGGLVIK